MDSPLSPSDSSSPEILICERTGNFQWVLARLHGREHAQHQHFQRNHIHFQQGDLVAEALVVPHAFGLGNALEALQLALGAVHIGNMVRSRD